MKTNSHIVQSPEWGRFKTAYGTKSVRVGNVQYTVHKIPFTSFYYAYAPKVNPFQIVWEDLKASLKENDCVAVNFDVPNVIKVSNDASAAETIFMKHCELSPRDTFAKSTILLDLTQSNDDLLTNMNSKQRYNIGLAERKGVTAKVGTEQEDFEHFYTLLKDTAVRQKYFIHPKVYYQKMWEILQPAGIAHILTTYFEGEPLTSWMLFTYDEVLYYPFGGSSEKHKNVMHSVFAGWEAIKFGKQKGCSTFDMWGSANDPEDEKDSWYGFTQFKLKFGGKQVKFIDSYDYVINKPVYEIFNLAQDIRWKILKALN